MCHSYERTSDFSVFRAVADYLICFLGNFHNKKKVVTQSVLEPCVKNFHRLTASINVFKVTTILL